MELNSQVNTFSKGMLLDIDPSFIPSEAYLYAENVRLLAESNSTSGSLQETESIMKYQIQSVGDYDFKKGVILGVVGINKIDSNMENIAVVLTKYANGNKIYNILWKVTGFDSQILTATPIVKGYLNISNRCKLVYNYEREDVINVYITDGESCIKSINIANDYPDDILQSTFFDITPGSILSPPELKEVTNG